MNNTVCGNFRSFNSLLVALLVSPILAGCGAKPDTHPGQPVTKREAIFHNMLRAFEPMGLMVRGREPYESDKFLKNAVALETLGKQPWSYFTAGSYYSPTRAKPTVWQYVCSTYSCFVKRKFSADPPCIRKRRPCMQRLPRSI
jgi:cytochrome c556